MWLSTRNLHLQLPCKKLSPRYVGLFQIIQQITPVSFRLALPNHYRITPTFHVSLLKPAVGPNEEGEEVSRDQSPLPIMVDGEEAYQVQELLNSRRRGRILQYLVDWEGYALEERSWVNADDILDPNLLEEFHRNHPNKPVPRPLPPWFPLPAIKGYPLTTHSFIVVFSGLVAPQDMARCYKSHSAHSASYNTEE